MEGVHWGTYLISMLLHSLFGLIHRAHDCDPAPPTISGLINRTFKLKVHFLNDVYSTFTDQYILYACALVCESNSSEPATVKWFGQGIDYQYWTTFTTIVMVTCIAEKRWLASLETSTTPPSVVSRDLIATLGTITMVTVTLLIAVVLLTIITTLRMTIGWNWLVEMWQQHPKVSCHGDN